MQKRVDIIHSQARPKDSTAYEERLDFLGRLDGDGVLSKLAEHRVDGLKVSGGSTVVRWVSSTSKAR
jgi:hypothetical protein